MVYICVYIYGIAYNNTCMYIPMYTVCTYIHVFIYVLCTCYSHSIKCCLFQSQESFDFTSDHLVLNVMPQIIRYIYIHHIFLL